MKNRLLLLVTFLALIAGRAQAAPGREYIVVTGGVSLYQWEKYKAQPHDHWWANFVHASRVRFEQIRQKDPDAQITWLVYKESYLKRGKQEGRDLIPLIESVRDACNVKLIWFNKTNELIDYLNSGQDRSQVKICNFEFYGHSNRACFMFDYSAELDSSSKCWLHQMDLTKINRGIFSKDAFAKSWGCHTGEEMSSYWRKATGIRMWGAIGKTDYSNEEQVMLSDANGKWVN